MDNDGVGWLIIVIIGLFIVVIFQDITKTDNTKIESEKQFILYKASYICKKTNELKSEE